MACGNDRCCNHCNGALELGPLTGRPNNPGLAFAPASDPRFVCNGDDSGLCCGLPVRGATVAVTGVLELVPGGGGRYHLVNPVVCTDMASTGPA